MVKFLLQFKKKFLLLSVMDNLFEKNINAIGKHKYQRIEIITNQTAAGQHRTAGQFNFKAQLKASSLII
jgi:hypothetical protein